MNDVAELALDTALGSGATYADARTVRERRQEIQTRNGRVAALGESETFGLGVRVLADGAWGFAAGDDLSRGGVIATAQRAVALARASALYRQRDVVLAPVEPTVASWAPPIVCNPFTVPLGEKIALLLESERRAREVAGLNLFEGALEFIEQQKHFRSSAGSDIRQDRVRSGAGISATAFRDGELQRRSYPASFGGQYLLRGWEMVEELDLPAHAPRIAEEAVALLDAPECPSRRCDLILEASQLALQVHESVGHPIELDRVLGAEANFAGGSFLSVDQVGSLRYGSPLMNVVVDARLEHGPGPGTIGYDDEGVAPTRTDIVREGIFRGFLTSRETAAAIGLPASNGCMRAEGWHALPLIRMTNVSLLPDRGTLEDLIADTADGILLATTRSWSIDDKRLNFQFGTEIGWEIRNGRRGRMVKFPAYGGMTPEFWGALDRVCGPSEWGLWGFPNCGKGQPCQLMEVGHGCAPARFRNVQVGVAR